MDLREIVARLLSVIFPCRCVLCERVVAYEDLWCGFCPFHMLADPKAGTDLVSPLRYVGGVREALLRLKKQQDHRTASFFALQMAGAVRKAWKDVQFSCIVPVPISSEGRRNKGFNHAELLAKELGALLKLPVAGDALSRRDGSRVQHELNAQERLDNAVRSYQVNDASVQGVVLLVDDIFTTGATTGACTACLRKMGAIRVCTVTAARTDSTRRGGGLLPPPVG